MKNLYKFFILLFLLLAFNKLVSAQKNYIAGEPVSLPGSVADVTAGTDDTLGFSQFFNGSNHYYVYGVNGGSGYIAGNNSYHDKQKAQVYHLSEAAFVKKIIFWFGHKQYNSGNPNSKIVAKVYTLDGVGAILGGQVAAPKTAISSVDINVSDIDTASDGYMIINLPAPVFVNSDFAVGFDVTAVAANDYVGCVSTKVGETPEDNLSWEQEEDNTWKSILHAWNDSLDIDLAIFPVISYSPAGENELFANGIKLSQNQPNPAISETTVQYEIDNNASVTFEMYDIMGKNVMLINQGEQKKGKHNINITTEKLAGGIYYYTLKANNNRLTRKMMVTK